MSRAYDASIDGAVHATNRLRSHHATLHLVPLLRATGQATEMDERRFLMAWQVINVLQATLVEGLIPLENQVDRLRTSSNLRGTGLTDSSIDHGNNGAAGERLPQLRRPVSTSRLLHRLFVLAVVLSWPVDQPVAPQRPQREPLAATYRTTAGPARQSSTTLALPGRDVGSSALVPAATAGHGRLPHQRDLAAGRHQVGHGPSRLTNTYVAVH